MSDEDVLRARLEDYERAFNAGDVETLGALFVEDGDLVDPVGTMTHGRTALEERWQKMFAAAAQRPTTDIQAESIRFVRPEIAIVDGTSMVFQSAAEGIGLSGIPGRYTSVWVKQSDQWLLHCLRPMVPVS
jgi:uncharacterized protein (TIGR02246 family)